VQRLRTCKTCKVSVPTTSDHVAAYRHAVLLLAPGVELSGRRFRTRRRPARASRAPRRASAGRAFALAGLPERLLASGAVGPETDAAGIEQLRVIIAQLRPAKPLGHVVLERRVTDLEVDRLVVPEEVGRETLLGGGVTVGVGSQVLGVLAGPVGPDGLADALDAMGVPKPGLEIRSVTVAVRARGRRLVVAVVARRRMSFVT